MGKTALIVVDVQRDFCEGGALAAADTISLMGALKEFIETARGQGAVIVYTQDWHPSGHSSFKANGGPWPEHCVENSAGAELMPPLRAVEGDVIIHKGVAQDGAGYSGFEATGLREKLRSLKIDHVGVAGVATEYCVKATALDAVRAGFQTQVLEDLIRPVQSSATWPALEEMKEAGVAAVSSTEWLEALQRPS